MTKKINPRRCLKCAHYDQYYGCKLDDLAPCRYNPEKDEKVRSIYLGICALVVLGLTIVLLLLHKRDQAQQTEVPHWSAVELLRNQHREELSDFDKLTLAIAMTESKFRADADSGEGDYGLLQLREIYLAEVNRISGSSYTKEDAFDISKSLAIFRALQAHYNPDKDLDKGIYYHNKSSAYKRAVMENYDLICRMEKVREELTK